MARCWTCGAHIDRPLFTCPACNAEGLSLIELGKKIERTKPDGVGRCYKAV